MILFHNPGLIDIDAAITLGVSVKEGDSPIGRFGTGVKFAISTVLRNGGSVTIWRGAEKYEFAAEKKTMRGEEFELVTMNGERLGFTTQLGRDWEPWMAFREFASNCRDEGGQYDKHAEPLRPCFRAKDDHTVIAVEGIDQVWLDRHTVMLESQPIASNDIFEVHNGGSPYVFYRGVRIYKSPRPMAFTYNVKADLELTEDRTAKTWWQLEIMLERGIGKLDDAAILRRILTCGEMFAEHHMNVPNYGQPGEAFGEAARAVALGPCTETANPAAVSFARTSAIEAMKPGEGMDLSPVQTQMLQRAKWMLTKGGFDADDFPVICLDTLGPNIHGLAKDGKIFIAASAFEKGTRELAATIFEEMAHLKSGQADCTRGFQNWLIDRVLIQIETAEGEPF